MADQYPNSGTLFVRDKRNPKAADYGGNFTLDLEVLDYVLRCAERGEEVKLDISGWKRQGRNNTNFISLKLDVPYSERQQNGGQQQRPQQQAPQQGRQSSRPYPDDRRQSYDRGQTIQTSRGQFQREQPRQRQELNDDIPFGNDPNKAPWDD